MGSFAEVELPAVVSPTGTSRKLERTIIGLNPDKDVTLLQTGGEATRLAALVNGSIDATVLNPPVHKRAVEAGE